MMTIPLPEPLFWDPVGSTGDYAIVDQESWLFLLRPRTGRVIARLRPLRMGEAGPLDQGLGEARPPARPLLSSPPGWPFRPGDEIPGTPAVGDLDADGSPEIVFATRSGWVWAVGRNGLPHAGWPLFLGEECVGSVALGDLEGDGDPEVLVGDRRGRVHAIRPSGASAAGWPAEFPGAPEIPGIESAVACADLDRDRKTEVVACQGEGRVCVFGFDGRIRAGWPVAIAGADDPPNAGTVFARPAVGDLDGDGRQDIVVAANNYRVHAWDMTGRPLPGWPRLLQNRARAGYADPTLVDLDGDGQLDVLVATDTGFRGPARIYALDAGGRDLRGWPFDLPERCNAGIAVADLDADQRLDVIAATVGEEGWILAWDARGRRRDGFPLRLAEVSVNASPVIADADGDGKLDILVSALRTGFEPTTVVIALDAGGNPLPRFPLWLEGSEVVAGGGCVADIDGDGLLEFLLGTEVQGMLFAWDLMGTARESSAPWPRPGFDCANTCRYRPPGAHAPVAATGIEPVPPEIAGPPPDYPFSPLSAVSFLLEALGRARLTILNVQGQEVRLLLDHVLPTGSYTIAWDGDDDRGEAQDPGVYFYELEIPGRSVRGQIILIR